MKTKKTLLKRIRITKTGKLMRGAIRAGHLKSKWSSSKKFRKAGEIEQKNKGHIIKLRKLLGKHA